VGEQSAGGTVGICWVTVRTRTKESFAQLPFPPESSRFNMAVIAVMECGRADGRAAWLALAVVDASRGSPAAGEPPCEPERCAIPTGMTVPVELADTAA
jgi:hypothetical protein